MPGPLDTVLHMRPDVRFVYQQEMFFVESPEIPSDHSHN